MRTTDSEKEYYSLLSEIAIDPHTKEAFREQMNKADEAPHPAFGDTFYFLNGICEDEFSNNLLLTAEDNYQQWNFDDIEKALLHFRTALPDQVIIFQDDAGVRFGYQIENGEVYKGEFQFKKDKKLS